MKITIYGWSTDVERLVKGPFCLVDGRVRGRRAGARRALRHLVMLAGVQRVARHAPGWRPGRRVGTTRRGMVDRRTTTLMYAGQDRRSAIRRKVPLTRNAAGQAGAHNTDGVQACDGGAPARRTDQLTSSADHEQMRWHRAGSGGHLGPQEAGELASDRGHDQVLGRLAGGQPAEASAEPQLGRPRASDDLRVQALLAAGNLGPDARVVLVGPGRLDQLGAQVGVAGLVRCPRQVRWPLEYSLGTSPQNPMNAAARANRRQSPTSAASVSAPSRVTPR